MTDTSDLSRLRAVLAEMTRERDAARVQLRAMILQGHCECPTVIERHLFGTHRDCEFYDHHCESCHEAAICTKADCVALAPPPDGEKGDR